MAWKTLRKRIRLFNAWRRKYALLITACLIAAGVGVGYMIKSNERIDPAVYTPLLNLIAKAESNGNYNAYFGNAKNTATDFTSMTIAEVLAWQNDFVKQGNPSSAVGRYQIINTTLAGLVKQLGVSLAQPFDAATQDRLAVALLERRGAKEYLKDEISREEFAANLAKEWAALPKVIGDNPHESFYATDGLNKSRVNIDEILSVIERTANRAS